MVPLCSLTIRAKSISNDSIFIKFLNIRRTISLFTTQTSDFFQNISTIPPVHHPSVDISRMHPPPSDRQAESGAFLRLSLDKMKAVTVFGDRQAEFRNKTLPDGPGFERG